MWIVISCALSAILCLLCLTGCLLAVRNAIRDSESTPDRLRFVELRSASLQQSLNGIEEQMLLIANRLKMQKVRNAVTHVREGSRPDGEPDPLTDPEAWRSWKNAQLRGH